MSFKRVPYKRTLMYVFYCKVISWATSVMSTFLYTRDAWSSWTHPISAGHLLCTVTSAGLPLAQLAHPRGAVTWRSDSGHRQHSWGQYGWDNNIHESKKVLIHDWIYSILLLIMMCFFSTEKRENPRKHRLQQEHSSFCFFNQWRPLCH